MRIALTLFFVLSIVTTARTQTSRPVCVAYDMPITIPPDAGIVVEGTTFSTTPEKSALSLTVVNHADSPITRVLILTELLDKDGQLVLTVPLLAAIRDETREEFQFAGTAGNELSSAVPLGKTALLKRAVQQVLSACPISARASMVKIKRSDGTKYEFTAPSWQIPASVRAVKALDVQAFPQALPFYGLVDVEMDAAGHVSTIATQTKDAGVQKWLQAALRDWSFNPAIRQGARVPSRIQLFLRLHDLPFNSSVQTVEPNFNESVFVIPVDVYPRDAGKPNPQVIFVGGAAMLL